MDPITGKKGPAEGFLRLAIVVAGFAVAAWFLGPLFFGADDNPPARSASVPYTTGGRGNGFSRYDPSLPGFHCADDPERCGGWRGFDKGGR